jgi:hypothetical protein
VSGTQRAQTPFELRVTVPASYGLNRVKQFGVSGCSSQRIIRQSLIGIIGRETDND